MRVSVHFPVDVCMPEPGEVFRAQGIPASEKPPERIRQLVVDALETYRRQAAPRGVLAEISVREFSEAYLGEGNNAPETPLADIFPKADHLALFAVTIGGEVEAEVGRLFARGEYGLGYVLDAVASAGAEQAADRIQDHFCDLIDRQRRPCADQGVLRYSPGYCGWHVSGQRKLFEALRPEQVGITLKESFLMEPLKSVSGVIVVGRKEIHFFDNTYPVCSGCASAGCVSRMEALLHPRC